MKSHNRKTDRTLIAAGLGEHYENQEGRAVIAARAAAADLDVGAYLRRRSTRRRLRARAADLGLAYWPALFTTGCNPRAFAIAEGILARKAGGLWGSIIGASAPPEEAAYASTEMRHGGWDSYGHHGISAGNVRDMWLAAGCRDTPSDPQGGGARASAGQPASGARSACPCRR